MLKSIAVAALLGLTQAADDKPGYHKNGLIDMDSRTEEERRGIQIMSGFFIGSGTVDLPPHKGKELENCANYLEHVVTYADNAYTSFKTFKKKSGVSEGFYDVMTGLKFISTSIHMITTSQKSCPTLAAEWDRIKEIADTWNHPDDFSFDNQEEILFNGENLYPYITKAIQFYEDKKYRDFGEQFGIMSEQIMIGQTLIREFDYDPRSQDTKRLYFQRWGAEFISGFAYGMHVGDFDQEMLYGCMAKEPRAEGVFYKGTVDLTRSLMNGDPKLGMKALDTFVAFVIDFAMEHKVGDRKIKICPELTAHQEKLANIYIMIKELVDKDETIKVDDDGNVSFNGQDMTSEIGIMIEAFNSQDAHKMGYIFADTLYNHLQRRGKSMPTLIM